jgi:hypothetical protein
MQNQFWNSYEMQNQISTILPCSSSLEEKPLLLTQILHLQNWCQEHMHVLEFLKF